MRQLGRHTQALEGNVRRWLEDHSRSTEVSSPFLDLSTPSLGEVTSIPVQTLAKPAVWLRESGLVYLLGIAVSILLGLPVLPKGGGIAWYIPVVAILAIWVQRLPFLKAYGFLSHQRGSISSTTNDESLS